MRLGTVDGRATVVGDRGGWDVEEESGGRFASDPIALLDRWDDFRGWADGHEFASPGLDVADRLGPPVPHPRQVVAIGLNYRGHAAEAGMPVPDVPVVFGKFPTCVAGPTGTIEITGDSIDWEAELVVVVGRRARHVAPGAGWDHVAGLTVGQDISDRALQFAGPVAQLTLAKSSPTFGPTGPVLVTPDELPKRDRLGIRCAVGDRVVQSATTDDLVFGVDRLVAYVSSVLELLPGDLLFTGTPAGCGVSADPPRFLRPGDRLVTEIDGIGRMVHDCVAAPTPEQE